MPHPTPATASIHLQGGAGVIFRKNLQKQPPKADSSKQNGAGSHRGHAAAWLHPQPVNPAPLPSLPGRLPAVPQDPFLGPFPQRHIVVLCSELDGDSNDRSVLLS